jgi:cell volume regulation protein A
VIVEQVLVGIALLLLASVFASRASGRLGVPALAMFLVLGMLAGSEGIGGIYFDDAATAQRLGVIALVFILFAGGMETDWTHIRRVAAPAGALATVGVLITAVLVGWFAHIAAGLSIMEGLLLGAIISSTDAAAVFSILRSKGVRLRRDLGALLEIESGSNDPMAVFLTTMVLGLMTAPGGSAWSPLLSFVQQMTFGAVAGIAAGIATVRLLNRARLEYQGLYPVVTIAMVMLTYGATAFIGGNGFLAVYLLGVVMARENYVQRRTLTRFHDGIAWLMQIAMFITLGLLVFPSKLPSVAGVSLAVAAVLMLVARPVAVLLTLAPVRMPLREKLLVAWVGLRGAVPIILATFPLVAGVPVAPVLFNIVFFIVFASVLLQGTTIAPVARWLGLDEAASSETPPETVHLSGRGESALVTLEVEEGSRADGHRVVELQWPRETLILVVYRGNEFFVPNGATALSAGDRLIVLTSNAAVDALRQSVTNTTRRPPELPQRST